MYTVCIMYIYTLCMYVKMYIHVIIMLQIAEHYDIFFQVKHHYMWLKDNTVMSSGLFAYQIWQEKKLIRYVSSVEDPHRLVKSSNYTDVNPFVFSVMHYYWPITNAVFIHTIINFVSFEGLDSDNRKLWKMMVGRKREFGVWGQNPGKTAE